MSSKLEEIDDLARWREPPGGIDLWASAVWRGRARTVSFKEAGIYHIAAQSGRRRERL